MLANTDVMATIFEIPTSTYFYGYPKIEETQVETVSYKGQ
jgi:hypothetical protein